MPKTDPAPEAKAPGSRHVWPSPDLAPTEYLPGIGADGARVPIDMARDLVARGLAVTEPPPAKGARKPRPETGPGPDHPPAAPAAPEKE